eukprot:TRINITY_DN3262_c0_g1_i1.p1 TRINITY_DN3262_c0_g1~~TRINITY_DN3262_c0_g1_i1.p1  ORF type:complete len:268 (+),score=50.97 TRINITY_DN3262_c0_g1_i1:98-901(+)
MSAGLVVYVRDGTTGSSVAVTLDPSATVADLREAYAEQGGGASARRMRLTFQGQTLAADAALADEGIGSECVVEAAGIEWCCKLDHDKQQGLVFDEGQDGVTISKDPQAQSWFGTVFAHPCPPTGVSQWQVHCNAHCSGGAGCRAGITLHDGNFEEPIDATSVHAFDWWNDGNVRAGSTGGDPDTLPRMRYKGSQTGRTDRFKGGETLGFRLDMDKKELRLFINDELQGIIENLSQPVYCPAFSVHCQQDKWKLLYQHPDLPGDGTL